MSPPVLASTSAQAPTGLGVTGGFVHDGDETMMTGRVWTVVRASYRAPDGATFSREVVRHPGAVAVVAVDGDGVVLVRQYRGPVDRQVLEIPAGLRDRADEDPAAAAGRELEEEAGLIAGRLEPLVTYNTAPGFTDEEVIVYLAEDLRPVERRADGVEERFMTIERLALDDVPAALTDGRIIDGKTLISLALLVQRRQAGA